MGSKVCRVLMHQFKCIEPPQTFLNHIIADITRCVEYFHVSLRWFDCTELHLYMQQGVQGAFAVVRAYRTFPNHIIKEITRYVGFFHMSLVVRLYQTFSNYIFTWEARGAGCLCTSSSASNLLEPHHCRYNKVWRVLLCEFKVV